MIGYALAAIGFIAIGIIVLLELDEAWKGRRPR